MKGSCCCCWWECLSLCTCLINFPWSGGLIELQGRLKKTNMLPFITPKCLGLLCVWVCCSVKVRVSGLWCCRSFHMIYVCCWKVLLLTTEALPSFIYWWRRSLTLWCVNLNAWRHFFCTIIKVLWQAATVSSLICTITVYFRVFNGMIFNKSFLFGDIFENII